MDREQFLRDAGMSENDIMEYVMRESKELYKIQEKRSILEQQNIEYQKSILEDREKERRKLEREQLEREREMGQLTIKDLREARLKHYNNFFN